ncbi:MAG TPA: N-acetyltransferase [Oceanospirillales bacterium]|nr:N-acetyltransferase [Oceanospirillales bacterium]
MENKVVISKTDRLILRQFNTGDVDFILQLVNAENWIQYIGDRNIKNPAQAQAYIEKSLVKSYKDHGYGLWLVQLKDAKTAIGMCGLVNREGLDDVDIGFAMLPQFCNKGYALEAAKATMSYAKNNLNIQRVIAITTESNQASIQLLNKIGLYYKKTVSLSKDNVVQVFEPMNN